MDLSNNHALVTGAGQGIGRAIALGLVDAGANVSALDLDQAALDETVSMRPAGAIRGIGVDLLDPEATAIAITAARDAGGPVDILVNNVGQGAREKASCFIESDPAHWDFMIDICLKTTIRCTHLILPDMTERGTGKIVNISSDSAYFGARASAVYAAAKNGVIGFTRSLARELANQGISVNAVAPGYIQTRAMDRLPTELIDKARADTPMGKLGTPEDVARMVVFLVGEGSNFVTGQTIIVNGGRWMT